MYTFIALNEINFTYIRKYIEEGRSLPFLSQLLKNYGLKKTSSESSYSELEPWIQWVSVHTGRDYDSHGVFHLGQVVESPSLKQFFESLEMGGKSVGALSPMNASNKLKHPKYFIPDAWTATSTSGGRFAERFSQLLVQSVNDNSSGRLTFASYITLLESMLRFRSLTLCRHLLRCVVRSVRKPWYRALVLEHIIVAAHQYFTNKSVPDFAYVFLNAGAHIQHHYMHNSVINDLPKNPGWYCSSADDPILDMLKEYDLMLSDIFGGQNFDSNKFMIATGLRQVPYEKPTFYYRLRHHAEFFKSLGLSFREVRPRMTRDLEVFFDSNSERDHFAEVISELRLERCGTQIFGEIDVGARSLFCSLVFEDEITAVDTISAPTVPALNLLPEVVFVALKNGKHDSYGYVVSDSTTMAAVQDGAHVSQLHDVVLKVV